MRLFSAFIIGVLPNTVLAEERWLCVPTAAIGFVFDEKSEKWVIAKFNVSNDQFIV